MTNLTTILVYFRDLTCIRYRKDLYMTWDGLFASFGGIFGLCLGGSILSVVEMLYFFTIKLVLTIVSKFQKRNTRPTFEKRINQTVNRKIYTLSPKLPHYANKTPKIVW